MKMRTFDIHKEHNVKVTANLFPVAQSIVEFVVKDADCSIAFKLKSDDGAVFKLKLDENKINKFNLLERELEYSLVMKYQNGIFELDKGVAKFESVTPVIEPEIQEEAEAPIVAPLDEPVSENQDEMPSIQTQIDETNEKLINILKEFKPSHKPTAKSDEEKPSMASLIKQVQETHTSKLDYNKKLKESLGLKPSHIKDYLKTEK